MRIARSLITLAVAFGFVACGGDGGTGPSAPAGPTFQSIAGTYNGALAGTAQGIALNAVFTLNINQSGGTLSGSYGMAGTLNDGVSSADVSGSGTVTGSIASGENPSVNLTVHNGACPNDAATFSGAYDSTNRKITISGPIDIYDTCGHTILTYQSTIILER